MGNKEPHKKLLSKWSKQNEELKKSIVSKHRDSLASLTKSGKNLAATSLASLILLSSGSTLSIPSHATASAQTVTLDKSAFLISDLKNLLPEEVGHLGASEEEKISTILSRDFGIRTIPI